MTTQRPTDSSTPWTTIAAVIVALAFGAVGACAVAYVALLRMRPPESVTGQAWRLMAVTALTTSAVGALGGGIAGLVLGLHNPPTAVFAIAEGGIIAGVPAFLLGALIGGVLALDHVHQATRRA